MKGTDLTPEGQIWICSACGKKSRTQFGFVDDGTPRGSDVTPDGARVADRGWDESCMMNAVLCRAVPVDGALAEELTVWAPVEPQPGSGEE